MTEKQATILLRIESEEGIVASFHDAVRRLMGDSRKHDDEAPHFTNQFLNDLTTAFTEGVANSIRHADELRKKGSVECHLSLKGNLFRMEIVDHGKGFDLEALPLPPFSEMAESGRGVFMIRQLVDTVEYIRENGRNTLIMTRELVGGDPETKALDLLYEISDAILATSDLESVYNVILDKTVSVFGVDRASILIYDKEVKRLKVVASRGLSQNVSGQVQVRPGEGISGYVFQHAKPCLIQDIAHNKSGWEPKEGYKSRSFISAPMICSPLRMGQESMGVINMTDRLDGTPFTQKDLRLLTTIANQATAYLHMVNLLSQAKDAEIIQRELEIAQKIQQSYLPSTSPRVENGEVAGWCRTAQSVGGDYFDYIEDKTHHLYLAVADVSGHNVAAALTMANFRSQLRALLWEEADPGRILMRLNQNIFDDLSASDQFVSMLLVRYLPREGAVEIANAGHRYPLIIRGGEVAVPTFDAAGAVLGAFPTERFETARLDVKPGDKLLFYTDGLTEMKNHVGDRYGIARLLEWAKMNSDTPLNKLMEKLSGEVDGYLKGLPPNDDITAVGLSIL